MTQNTSEKDTLAKFKKVLNGGMGENISVMGRWKFEITRADGSVEKHECNNIVTKDGLNHLAALAVTAASSPFAYIAIGTATAAGSLGSVQGGLGEVERKIGATISSSNEVAILVATWAGDADGLTGVALGSAGIINHANSGSGVFGNHVNSVDATLNASDFLKVQMEIKIGSHAL